MPGIRSHRLPAGRGVTVGYLGAGGKPMAEAAGIVAARAREISGRWSHRVPLSVRVGVAADGKSALILAGGDAAPQAATFELGLSHPVYGRPDRLRKEWAWVKQIARPFLAEAAESAATRAADAFGDAALTAWARHHGYR